MQNNVDLHEGPSAGSLVKQQLSRNSKVYILEVVKGDGQDWVKVRDDNGREGYISGNTRINVIQQKTKAMGRKNILSGAMWLIAGLVITFSGTSPASGGSFYLLGYGAILFGVVMLIMGVMQFLTAPT
jgi:predicted phage tail protein